MSVKEIVSEHVDSVGKVLREWKDRGPTAVHKHFDLNIPFGIEVECFMEHDRNDIYTHPITETVRRRIHPIATAAWQDVVMGNIPAEIGVSIGNNSYGGRFGSENKHVERIKSEISLYERDKERSIHWEDYVPGFFISLLQSGYGLFWLAYKEGLLDEPEDPITQRARALGEIIDKLPGIRLGYDGTVPGTQDEIVTPVLKGKTGLAKLQVLLSILNKNGFICNSRCGSHTSITYKKGVGKITSLLSLLILWGTIEKEYKNTLQSIGYRYNSAHARLVHGVHPIQNLIQEFPEKSAPELLNSLESDPSEKYRTINIGQVLEKRRVEFRAWEGTINPDQWIAQVVLGQIACKEAAKLSRKLANARKKFRESVVVVDDGKLRATKQELYDKYGFKDPCSPDCIGCKNVKEDYIIIDSAFPEERWFVREEISDVDN